MQLNTKRNRSVVGWSGLTFCHIRVACLFPFIYFAYFMQVLPQHQGWRVGGNKSVRCHLAPLPFGWHLRVLRHF